MSLAPRRNSLVGRALATLAVASPASMSPLSITDALGAANQVSKQRIQQALQQLRRSGFAERVRRGYWRITHAGERANDRMMIAAGLAGCRSNIERVRDVLQDAEAPMDSEQIADHAGIARTAASNALSRLATMGEVVRTNAGCWTKVINLRRIEMGLPTDHERLRAHSGLAAHLGQPLHESELYDRGERAYVAHCAVQAGAPI